MTSPADGGAQAGGPGVWTDRDGAVVAAAEPPPEGSCYRALGDFQGAAYERNAFARGTAQEVAFLAAVLDLRPGMRVVDVGCGTGRHARALQARGLEVLGADVSHGLLAAAAVKAPGRWVQADARALPLRSGCADAVVCLCQGGFGLTPRGDEQTLGELARILRPGGQLALTAFSAWFAARYAAPDDALDVGRSMLHNQAEVRAPAAAARQFPLWTTCYTVPHLELLARHAGLVCERIVGAAPGAYADHSPRITDPELLLFAHKPDG